MITRTYYFIDIGVMCNVKGYIFDRCSRKYIFNMEIELTTGRI
ncbi:hypothetical protein QW060_08780 [Myroides ceti]|uniref:Uncharacterized protein n=1 Tax=Paenimyroides ceti TaxID=395087 RepID=A0ABT8CUB3_9FLAO|nr:hypothetical protein [Paenimyroides ceti]MDN3707228.1 hypothetical protein [Paenimyroides ceti]